VLLRRLTGNRPLKQHGDVPHVEAFAGAPDLRQMPHGQPEKVSS
jgi:multidrug efflux pump